MRKKGVFLDFIKDSVNLTIIYFLNTFILLLFFYLYYENAEIVYPLCLSVFIFSISIVLKWFRYKAFNTDIDMNVANVGYRVQCFTKEEKRVAKAVKELHLIYGKQLSNIKIGNREHRRSNCLYRCKVD